MAAVTGARLFSIRTTIVPASVTSATYGRVSGSSALGGTGSAGGGGGGAIIGGGGGTGCGAGAGAALAMAIDRISVSNIMESL
ncbi:hypothetical protein GCM10009115_28280 [Sphingopyxis soli]|uniref:Uncharacterized protein n=1 Tax=Sphingopyxis soli TaxID=592051 RepID=A0ABP3XN77_9SPHN